MKKMGTIKYFYLLQIIALLISCNKPHYYANGVIEFYHTGITDCINDKIIISTQKVDVHLSTWEMKDLKERLNEMHGKITEQSKRWYINMFYDSAVTDRGTFLALDEFIVNHPQYFDDGKNWEASYAIWVNGTKYAIAHKFTTQFFKDLKMNLAKKGCDKKVSEILPDSFN